MAAARWSELGCDSREMAAFRICVLDRPTDIQPFHLRPLRLSPGESGVMKSVIKDRLDGRILEELSRDQAR